MNLKNRNFGLDLIRAMAIILVFISHLGISKVSEIKIGNLGVEIFFVLSGFLIGQIIIKDFSSEISIKTLFHFWKQRWYRTLPLYYLAVVLKFIFIDSSLNGKVLVYFVFLQNNFVGIDFMQVSWSLVIEEWFYFLVPIIIFLLFRKGISGKSFIFFLIAFILFENLIRYFWATYTNVEWAGFKGNILFRLDSLMVGILLASIKIFKNNIYAKMNNPFFFIIASTLFFVLLYCFNSVSKIEGLKDTLLWTRVLWFSFISITIAFLLPFIEGVKVGENSIFKNVITIISIHTYSIYLIHAEVIHFIVDKKSIYTFHWVLQSLLAIVITSILSFVAYKYYEKPMTNLRDKKY